MYAYSTCDVNFIITTIRLLYLLCLIFLNVCSTHTYVMNCLH